MVKSPPGRGKSNVSQFIESASYQCQGVCEELLGFLSLLLLSLSTKQYFAKKKFLFVEKVVNNTIKIYLPPNFMTLCPILTLFLGWGSTIFGAGRSSLILGKFLVLVLVFFY